MLRSCHRRFFSILAFLLFLGSSAQEPLPQFRELAETILAEENATFKEFEEKLEPYSNDTFLLLDIIEKSRSENRWKALAFGYLKLGNHWLALQDYEKAIQYHELAWETALLITDIDFRMRIENELGRASFRGDLNLEALKYHYQVIEMGKNARNPEALLELGYAYQGIGNLYKKYRTWDLAIDYFQTSQEYFNKIQDQEGLAWNYQYIAESQEAMGNVDQALAYYHRSKETNKTVQSGRMAVINEIGIAHVLTHMDRLEAANGIMESLRPQIEASDQADLKALYFTQFGWVLLQQQRFEQAEALLKKGLEISEENKLKTYQYDANTWLHDLWEDKGDFEKALRYYKKAIVLRTQVVNNEKLFAAFNTVAAMEKENREIQLQMLSRDNDIISLKYKRNQTTLLVGALLLVLFSLVLYVIYRQSQLNNEKKILGLEQSRLRSQMNPHFLFNALNSIKHYIINNEPKNAVHYLNKFSKLIRKILETSSMKEVTLQDELETVALYMNIENIRFNEQIDFKIEVDPEINPATVKIPSMILQPFLENSLWHGLSSKDGEKSILLGISRDDPAFLTITIEDNGIGRKASRKIKARRTFKTESLGIPITRERLSYFSRLYQNSYDLDFEDLFKKDGSSDGTRVVLKIPTSADIQTPHPQG
jgi:tetratricopeptide (TPR) repeat protein